jgi:glycine/D-amino acid oxidase-like deaminating enzyme
MTSKSLWMDIDVAPDAEVLDGVHECDVAVIGSGIAGLSTAYELCKRGKSVIVIDRGRICGGMTSRTSAHLAPLCDDLVSEMTKIRGNEATKLFCDSQAAAVDRIEEIQKKEKIDCDFRRLDGYLFQGRDMPAETIDREMDAVRDVGAPVHRLMGVPLIGCEDRHVLRYPRQATFHPLKYLAGVAKACSENGVTFFRDSPVEEVTEDDGVVTVKTASGVIRARHVVVATNSSISDRWPGTLKPLHTGPCVITFEIKRGVCPMRSTGILKILTARALPGPANTDYVMGVKSQSGEADDADERSKLEVWARGLISGPGNETPLVRTGTTPSFTPASSVRTLAKKHLRRDGRSRTG